MRRFVGAIETPSGEAQSWPMLLGLEAARRPPELSLSGPGSWMVLGRHGHADTIPRHSDNATGAAGGSGDEKGDPPQRHERRRPCALPPLIIDGGVVLN